MDSKERLTTNPEVKANIRMPEMVDLRKQDVPKEVESWLQKIEKDPTQKTVNDHTGQPILMPSVPSDPKIILPVTKTEFSAGFKKGISDAGRWLSVFIFRLIKIKKGEVEFKENAT